MYSAVRSQLYKTAYGQINKQHCERKESFNEF